MSGSGGEFLPDVRVFGRPSRMSESGRDDFPNIRE